ncbi:MAG: RHS repeat-associated core domain-containing protein [Acidobacteriota bacterium]
MTKGSGTASSFAYSASTNRITTSGYGYDSNGNLTSMPGLTLGYDVLNRVVSVTGTSVNEQYGYDPGNRRMWRPLPAGAFEITFYGMAGERLGTWKLLSGQLTNLSTNLYFAGKLIRQKQINAYGGVEDAAVVTDRMGSVRMRTNFGTASSDIILQSARLYPFGEELSPATANDRDKFATYHRDNSTGLDYAMNRYYGSTLGRFTSTDPYLPSVQIQDPQTWNRYAYVANDPVNKHDPDGLRIEEPGWPCPAWAGCGWDSLVGAGFRDPERGARELQGDDDSGTGRTVGSAQKRFYDDRELITDAVLNSKKCKDFLNKWLTPWGKTIEEFKKLIFDARALYGEKSNEPVWVTQVPAKRVFEGGSMNFQASMNGKNLVFFRNVESVYQNSNYRNAAVWIHESAHNLNVGPSGGPMVFQEDDQLGAPFGKSREWGEKSTLITDAIMENCFPGKK